MGNKINHKIFIILITVLIYISSSSDIHASTARTDKIGMGARSFWTGENQLAKSKIPDYISTIASTKVGYVRVFVSWNYIQPPNLKNASPTDWQWEKVDLMINEIKNNGMDPVIMLYNPPAWATTVKGLPEQISWRKFVTKIVNRYGYSNGNKQVKYWEILNEPDASTKFTGIEYGKFLEFTYPIIKSLDPQSQVLLAGLTQLSTRIDNGDWLNKFLTYNNAEFANYFDIFNVHAYGDTSGGGITRAKSILSKWPTTKNKPFWVTEANLGSNIYKPITPCLNVEDLKYLTQIETMFTNMLTQGADKVFLHSAECTYWTGPSIFIRESEGSDTPALIIRQNVLTRLTAIISSFISTKPGDFNGDGKVDLSDYNLIVSNFGNPYTIFDYNTLVANYRK